MVDVGSAGWPIERTCCLWWVSYPLLKAPLLISFQLVRTGGHHPTDCNRFLCFSVMNGAAQILSASGRTEPRTGFFHIGLCLSGRLLCKMGLLAEPVLCKRGLWAPPERACPKHTVCETLVSHGFFQIGVRGFSTHANNKKFLCVRLWKGTCFGRRVPLSSLKNDDLGKGRREGRRRGPGCTTRI